MKYILVAYDTATVPDAVQLCKEIENVDYVQTAILVRPWSEGIPNGDYLVGKFGTTLQARNRMDNADSGDDTYGVR